MPKNDSELKNVEKAYDEDCIRRTATVITTVVLVIFFIVSMMVALKTTAPAPPYGIIQQNVETTETKNDT